MKLILSSLLVMLMASGCNNAWDSFHSSRHHPLDPGINNTNNGNNIPSPSPSPSPTNDENLDNETDSSGNRTTTNGRASDKYGLKETVRDLGIGTVVIAVVFAVAYGLDYVCRDQDDDSSSSGTPWQSFNVEGQTEE